MKILIAPDSFKENLTAMEVAENLETGLKAACQEFNIKKIPMADGGEGTVRALVQATDGKFYTKNVTGPAGKTVEAKYGILGDGKTAVIEMAAASGLQLISEQERDPEKTTTYGTGELIEAALDKGCRKLIIGIGGSATNDCGVGMAQALGGSFLDKHGQEVGYGGRYLSKITRTDLSQLDHRIKNTEIQVACDVDNPLSGENGAAHVYAPQKGASLSQVEKLDKGLRHISRIIKNDLGKEVAKIPGAGAAGGLGAGLMAFFDAELRSGIDIVIETSGIKGHMQDIDIVITGEGKIDNQTVSGKAPIGVAKAAQERSIFVIGIAGSIGDGAEKAYEHGIDALFSIVDSPMNLQESYENSARLLVSLGKNIGELLKFKIK